MTDVLLHYKMSVTAETHRKQFPICPIHTTMQPMQTIAMSKTTLQCRAVQQVTLPEIAVNEVYVLCTSSNACTKNEEEPCDALNHAPH